MTFLALVLACSLPFWLAGQKGGELLPGLPASALMAVCPLVAAVALIWRNGGAAGVRGLWGAERRPRAGSRVSVVLAMPGVVLAMPGVVLLGSLLTAGGRPPGAAFPAIVLVLLPAVFTLSALAEQLGWTGYLQPSLRARFGHPGGAVVLGLCWGLWHVIPYAQAGRAVGWIVGQVVFSVAFRVVIEELAHPGSVTAAAVVHASYNTAWFFAPSYDPAVVSALTATLAVVLVLVRPGRRSVSGGPRPSQRERLSTARRAL